MECEYTVCIRILSFFAGLSKFAHAKPTNHKRGRNRRVGAVRTTDVYEGGLFNEGDPTRGVIGI